MHRSWTFPTWWLVAALVFAVAAMLSVGKADVAHGVQPINFIRGTIAGSGFATSQPGSLAVGPDGRLYVADVNGRIQALTLNPSKAVTAVQQVATSAQLQEVFGIAFDPTDASSPPTVYVTNTVSGFGDAGQAPAGSFPGKVTRISGAAYATRTDIITGLPVANSGHEANGLTFGPDGRLYVAQGGTTNAGVINPAGGLFQREEVPTGGAILVADVKDPLFDGNIIYSPVSTYSTGVQQTAGDVDVFASGLRNPYDLLFHSENGIFYNTDNGPNAGYGPGSLGCFTNDGIDAQAADELNIIEAGRYYGHPNRNRGINLSDPLQCDYKAGTEPSAGNYRAPIALLPPSSDGIAEYKSGVFGGQLQGDLLYVSWVDSTLHRVQLSADGLSVVSDTTLASNLPNALDVAVGPDGTIYVAEYGGNKITYFKPDESAVSSITVTGVSPAGGSIDGGQAVTVTGTNFTTAAETTVTFGGTSLNNIVVQNSTTMTGVTAAHAAGQVDVVVTNTVGNATLPAGFNYSAGGGVLPPTAAAGDDWSGPIAHNDHSHVTLDGRASVDPDGFIATYEWTEGATVLSTNSVDSKQFTLGEHFVTLKVTDNDGNIDTDSLRIIVTQFAENPKLYYCFDVTGDGSVNVVDLQQVAAQNGKRFGQPGYTRLKDWNANGAINVVDLFGTARDITPSCPLVDRQIRAAVVGSEQYNNINAAFAAGFVQVTPYIPGQGRHLVRGTVGGQDDVFDPALPESLLYEPDSNRPGGWKLGGLMYIMPIDIVPLPPDGFAGNEDAWHYHDALCLWNNFQSVQENVDQATCLARSGNPVWIDKAGWLVHIWAFSPNPLGRFVEVNAGF